MRLSAMGFVYHDDDGDEAPFANRCPYSFFHSRRPIHSSVTHGILPASSLSLPFVHLIPLFAGGAHHLGTVCQPRSTELRIFRSDSIHSSTLMKARRKIPRFLIEGCFGAPTLPQPQPVIWPSFWKGSFAKREGRTAGVCPSVRRSELPPHR